MNTVKDVLARLCELSARRKDSLAQIHQEIRSVDTGIGHLSDAELGELSTAKARRMAEWVPRLDQVKGTDENLQKAREILGTIVVDTKRLMDIEKELQEVERLLSEIE